MATLPEIYTIQAFDAPQHTDRLREILQELKTENRISGFTTLGADDDLSSISDTLKKDDMILILLTNELEEKREQVKKSVKMLISNQPGLRVAEILVDNVIYDNDFITFPDDLRPIRNREDMDEAWNNIARSLRDMFPVKKKRKKKPFPLWIVFVVLGVLLFGGILTFILLSRTTVPDLAGMHVTDAISLLINAGLEAGERSVESHDTVEKDLVIRTEPYAGESIKKGTHVNLILSGGRGQIPVPELTGVTLDRAKSELEGAGLRVGQQRSERSNQVGQGRVIRSDPEAGREVDRGSQINLVISSGSGQVRVPELAGVTLDRARAELERAGLRVGQQRSEHSNQVGQGRVIRSDPEEGREIDRGSQINLVTSLGPSTSPIPPGGFPLPDLVLQEVSPITHHLKLPAPSQMSPDDGAVVGSGIINPLGLIRTNVSWSAVNGAVRYGLEWVALSPGQPCHQINDSHNLRKQEDIQGTTFPIRHTRITAICWRVYAVNTYGIDGHRSDWRQFRSN